MKIKQRVLGRTGMEISEIGFGAWAIGGEISYHMTHTLHLVNEMGLVGDRNGVKIFHG